MMNHLTEQKERVRKKGSKGNRGRERPTKRRNDWRKRMESIRRGGRVREDMMRIR